jgi:hypothetical protein
MVMLVMMRILVQLLVITDTIISHEVTSIIQSS